MSARHSHLNSRSARKQKHYTFVFARLVFDFSMTRYVLFDTERSATQHKAFILIIKKFFTLYFIFPDTYPTINETIYLKKENSMLNQNSKILPSW